MEEDDRCASSDSSFAPVVVDRQLLNLTDLQPGKKKNSFKRARADSARAGARVCMRLVWRAAGQPSFLCHCVDESERPRGGAWRGHASSSRVDEWEEPMEKTSELSNIK